jgi:hypothetical protein
MHHATGRRFRRPTSRSGTVWRLGAALLAALLLLAVAQPTAASGRAASTVSADSEPGDSYPDFAVSISGPAPIAEYDDATYTAVPSYGTGPYTYTWFKGGWQVGTGPTYSVYLVRSSFTLQVNATDALGNTASATLRVYVVPECRTC